MIKENLKNKILDSLDELVFLTDENFNIQWFNEPAKKIFVSEISGRNLHEILNIPSENFKNNTEIESAIFNKKNEKLFFTHKLIKTGVLKKESTYLIISRNITDKLRDKNLLRSMIQSENLLTKIVSKTSGMMAYTDSQGFILMHNESFAKFHENINPKNTERVKNIKQINLAELYLDSISSGKENFIAAFENCKKGIESKTEIWTNKNNNLRLFEVFFQPIIQNMEIVTGIIFNSNDITERVQLEARILEVIHTERKKIGISLHDDLGHDLLAVAIKSRLIYDKLKKISPELSEGVREIETSIKLAIDEVRRLSRGLIPYKNNGLDLKEMLDAISITIEKEYKLKCNFSIDKKIDISDESIIKELFYIIDEAVLNSLKHSECSLISIEMYQENNMIILRIIDDGKGISHNNAKKAGVGLEIMNYRARALGGGLEITGNPTGGTTITCIFSPVKIQV